MMLMYKGLFSSFLFVLCSIFVTYQSLIFFPYPILIFMNSCGWSTCRH